MKDAARDDREVLYAELAANERVGARLRNATDHVFVSDWNGNHLFVDAFLNGLADVKIGELGDLAVYSRMDADHELATAVADLHVGRYRERSGTAEQCILGAGSTAFLTTILMHQFLAGTKDVAYLPPVHSTVAWWIRTLGFGVRRVASDVDFAKDVRLELPKQRCLLWLTDPVWFAGLPVREETIDEIAAWQQRTGSTVVVDGTFQYMSWDGAGPEATERLDPDLTYRLVCPTKALSVHGFRFAYTIVPKREALAFGELHGRLHGAAGLADRLFAHRAIATLKSDQGIQPLMDLARQRYHQLVERRVVTADVQPKAGYFLFARPTVPAGRIIGMDMECFGGTGYPGFIRINLLNDTAIECILKEG